jgi:hypothetical protein
MQHQSQHSHPQGHQSSLKMYRHVCGVCQTIAQDAITVELRVVSFCGKYLVNLSHMETSLRWKCLHSETVHVHFSPHPVQTSVICQKVDTPSWSRNYILASRANICVNDPARQHHSMLEHQENPNMLKSSDMCLN